MSTTLKLTGTALDLRLQAGDDVDIRFTFDTDIDGWTDWFGQIRSKRNVTWDFTPDDTDQATGIIYLRLDAADTTDMYGKAPLRWQFQALDADGRIRTLMGGAVTVEKDEAQP